MTRHTRKPEEEREPSRFRWMAPVILLVFAVTAMIVKQIMHPPYRRSDYLIIGSLATFVALLALFVTLKIADASRKKQ